MPAERADNLYELFAATATRFPTRVAVEILRRDGVLEFTYAELRAMAERAAALLAAHGVAAGNRCALLAENCAEWCAVYLGVLRLGALAVPLDTAYQPAQIAKLLTDSGACTLFTSPHHLAAARLALTACTTPPELLLLRRPASSEEGAACATGIASLDEAPVPLPATLPPCTVKPNHPALILYTSGTTSDPKGVVLTHGNLLAERNAAFSVIRVDERDCILGVLPLFHSLPQVANLLLPFAVGARVVFLETINSTEILRALRERNITAFCCVPQFFYLIHQRVMESVASASLARRMAFRALLGLNGWLREHASINLGGVFFRRVHDALGKHMRLLVTGGSRFEPAINHDLYRLGFDLLHAYGLTESSAAAALTRPGSKYSTSVGLPLPGVEIRILPREFCGADVGAATEGYPDGEILVRGLTVMQGYWNRSDATAASIVDGWLHTGDLGYLDAAGRLHITGRLKEMIVLSSGKNIYPEEIEAHYLQSPYIKEICVLGRARPGEPSAERLHAVVVPNFELLRERKVVNAREVLRYEIEGLSIHLPSHKRVLSYEIWTEDLPRTTTRKLKRFEIERRARAGTSAEAESEAAAEPALSEADLAWAARPEVARAFGLIRGAAKPRARLRPDANLELDLGLDSMERVELLENLQREFGTEVPDEVAHHVYTVRELIEAVAPQAGIGAIAGAAEGASGAAARDPWGSLLAAAPQDDPEFAALLRPRPIFAAATFVLMKILYGCSRLLFRFRATSLENLPPRGPFLLCPNHQSYLDPFFLACALPFRVFRELFFVGASEYFATPRMRWVARQINLIPVDPDTNLLRAMQAGAFGLRHAKVLVLFPEGERSIDGGIKKFKKGASILSLHLRAPIVPVALDGVFDLWPRGRAFRWRALVPGGPVRIAMRFGAPIAPPEAVAAESTSAQAETRYAAAAEQLRSVVLAIWRSLGAQPRAEGMV